jgi:hypothetical protein
MKEVAGSQTFLTGSAVHRDRAPIEGGNGLVKSRAEWSVHGILTHSDVDLLIDNLGW